MSSDEDPSIWDLVDSAAGKIYRSIPTNVPKKWTPTERWSPTSFTNSLLYVSGDYEIERKPYGKSGYSYSLKRKGVELFGLHPRLKDAEAHAEKNARGEETVHVA